MTGCSPEEEGLINDRKVGTVRVSSIVFETNTGSTGFNVTLILTSLRNSVNCYFFKKTRKYRFEPKILI